MDNKFQHPTVVESRAELANRLRSMRASKDPLVILQQARRDVMAEPYTELQHAIYLFLSNAINVIIGVQSRHYHKSIVL